MHTYLEFINENNDNQKQEILDFFKAFYNIKEYYGNNYFSDSFSNIARLVSGNMFNNNKITDKEINKRIELLKSLFIDNGWSLDRIKKMINNDMHIFFTESESYMDKFREKYNFDTTFTDMRCYSGYLDILLYELSDSKFLLGGYDINYKTNSNIEVDLLTKYNYGWHNNKYGKLAIEQSFKSIDDFIDSIMTNINKDMNYVHDFKELDKINDYYFTCHDIEGSYFDDDMKKFDYIFTYNIYDTSHVVSYKKNVGGDLNNFYIVLKELEDEKLLNNLLEYKWPNDFLEELKKDPKYKNLVTSASSIKKFNL